MKSIVVMPHNEKSWSFIYGWSMKIGELNRMESMLHIDYLTKKIYKAISVSWMMVKKVEALL